MYRIETKFTIAESNDIMYDIILICIYILCGCLTLVILLLHLHENNPALLIILLITLVSVFALRFFIKNHITNGEIEIKKNKIYIIENGQEILFNEITRIEFKYQGFFGAVNNKLIPTEDGTGNILTIKNGDSEIRSVNLYLANSTNKRDLVYVLERFCESNKVEFHKNLY